LILVPCPWCGRRNSQEFRYVGEAKARPDPASTTPDEWRAYLYLKANPADWVIETWFHRSGCRRYLSVERHTVTNVIRSSDKPAAQRRLAGGGA
jgi:sarcosine oxidase subunit delta